MTYPNGVTTEYSYDQNNRLIKQVNKVRRGIISQYEYTLDAAGNRVQVKEKYDYAFSKEMREQGVGEVYAGVNDISRQKDKNSKDGISLVTTYAYDPLNRLTSVKYPLGNTVTYSYDPMGNRMSMVSKLGKISSTTSYTYDAGDQLLSAGKTSFAYDNNGNMIQKTEQGKTTTYAYDGSNRLSTVTLSQSSGHRMAGLENSVNENDAETSRDSVNEKDTGASRNAGKGKAKTTTVHFTYDGDGVRTGKSVTTQSKTDATQYLWDINHGLPQILTESDAKGTALYSYGLGRISMADPRKGPMYYQYDGLGSVRSLTDRKGMTKGLYAYDAFGKPLISASLVDNDFQYTGEQVDDETGLIYLRSRYYDPEIGRFISRDSFPGFDTSTQSLNRYTYVQNNPVVYTDPSGKNPLVAIGLAGLYGACANTGWYIGEMAAIYAQTGEIRGSLSTLGGRAAGGFAAGSVGAVSLLTTKNPIASGAAAGGSGYAVDRWTQGQLQNLGLGRAEPGTLGGLALATGTGAVMGPVTNMIIPSPAATQWLGGGRADISRTGTALLNSAYNSAPGVYNDAYNYVTTSNQGPIRLSSSGSYSAGKLY
jgi:RHS repeat-associated protein